VACKPREILNESDESASVDLSLFRQIKELLHCPVCYDVLKDPLNVKMCLHKFCSNCIENFSRTVYASYLA
jgi:hypothetical protein